MVAGLSTPTGLASALSDGWRTRLECGSCPADMHAMAGSRKPSDYRPTHEHQDIGTGADKVEEDRGKGACDWR